MSGGGGGGDPTGGGLPPGEVGPELDCASLYDRTILNSPVPDVLSKLKKGGVLSLTLSSPKGPLLAVTDGGETAGSITSSKMVQLILCIEQGFRFIAIIQDIVGGRCDVLIRPESKQ